MYKCKYIYIYRKDLQTLLQLSIASVARPHVQIFFLLLTNHVIVDTLLKYAKFYSCNNYYYFIGVRPVKIK